MIKEKKDDLVNEVKLYVGDKTLKGASKLSPYILRGIGYAVGTVVSAIFAFKIVQSFKK